MSDNGCVHLDYFKSVAGVEKYRIIHSYFVSSITHESRKTKWKFRFCRICRRTGPRLHSCLECVFFGCYNGHIQEHSQTSNHLLAIDLSFGNVLCLHCNDYVYDIELLSISKELNKRSSFLMGISSKCTKWEPSQEELELMQSNSRRRMVHINTTIGLRGLLNLGNTCFMNCIVQTLMHTPVLKDYFLSERHVCQFTDPSNCLVCEVSVLFQEFYSGAKEPLTTHRALHLIWNNAKHLVGSQQQDAHEFFIAMLNILHRHCKKGIQQAARPSNNANHCSCIVDQIFTGGLQSDIVCQSCNGVSTTVEPFRDISLDIGSCISKEINGIKPINGVCMNGYYNNTSPHSNKIGPVSLIDCLEQFTKPEHLGSTNDEKIKCAKCEDYQESTKQFTIRTLPIVTCFHLKRFKHSSRFQKISTLVAFPDTLDMTPFMSCHHNGPARINNSCCGGHVSLEDNRYSLFAVVNHKGSYIGGHYIAYIKQQQDQWFKCDDHKITRANIRDVLNSEGYMLFYHKNILEYE